MDVFETSQYVIEMGTWPLSKMERILHVYKTKLNPYGTTGDFSITKMEMIRLFEINEELGKCTWIETIFKTLSIHEHVDLYELLSIMTILCSASLKQKCIFLFTLFDFGKEDELLVDEMGFFLHSICKGLVKIGLLEAFPKDNDLYILANSCQNNYENNYENENDFEITKNDLYTWMLQSHHPQLIWNRIGFVYRFQALLQRLQKNIDAKHQLVSPSHREIALSLQREINEVDPIRIITGPIVGKVTKTSVVIVLEVNTTASVSCILYVLPRTSSEKPLSIIAEMKSFIPSVFTFSGLESGRRYEYGFIGVDVQDQKECVGAFTTYTDSSEILSSCNIILFNHDKSSSSLWTKEAQDMYASEIPTPCQPRLHIHGNSFVFSNDTIHQWCRLLEMKSYLKDVDDLVLNSLRSVFRTALHCISKTVLSYGSNWFLPLEVQSLWKSGENQAIHVAQYGVQVTFQLETLFKQVEEEYIGNLWSSSTNTDPYQLPLVETKLALLWTGHQAPLDPALFYTHLLKLFKNHLEENSSISNDNLYIVSETLVVVLPRPLFIDTPLLLEPDRLVLIEAIQTILRWKKQESDVRNIVFTSFSNIGKVSTLNVERSWHAPFLNVSIGPLYTTLKNKDAIFENKKDTETRYTVPTGLEEILVQEKDDGPHFGLLSISDEYVMSGKIIPTTSFILPKLLLGPMIGRIESTYVIVLIECETSGILETICIDEITGEVINEKHEIKGGRPFRLTLSQLLPGRRYRLCIKGISNADSGQHGLFQTPHRTTPTVNTLILTHETEKTKTISQLLDEALPLTGDHPFDLILHLGGNVPLHDALQRCRILLRGCTRRTFPEYTLETIPADIISQCQDCLREALRHYWNTPEMTLLLRRGSHLILPRFSDLGSSTLFPSNYVEAEWDDTYLYDLCHSIWTEYTQLLWSSNKTVSSKNGSTSTGFQVVDLPGMSWILFDPSILFSFLKSDDFTLHFLQSLGETIQTTKASVLCLVSAFSPFLSLRKTPDEVQEAYASGKCPSIWRLWSLYPSLVESILDLCFSRSDRKFLFVSAGSYDSYETIITSKRKTDENLKIKQIVIASKITTNHTNTILPHDNVLLLGNGPYQYQHCIPDKVGCKVRVPEKNDSMIEEPVVEESSDAFALLRITPNDGTSPSVESHLMFAPSTTTSQVILGPIVGKVTATSARILYEVSQAVECCCTLTNTMDDTIVTKKRKLVSNEPFCFSFTDLEADTQYTISFTGPWNASTVSGTLRTLSLRTIYTELAIVSDHFLSHFIVQKNNALWCDLLEPGRRWYNVQQAAHVASQSGNTLVPETSSSLQDGLNPWADLLQNFTFPHPSPAALLHIGGQVELERAFSEQELATLTHRLATLSPDEMESEIQNIVFPLLRNVYRIAWGLPPFNHVLNSCSNLMLYSESDLFFHPRKLHRIRKKYIPKNSHINILVEDTILVSTKLREGAKRIWAQYQNQLWSDNLYEKEDSIHTFGSCAVVMLCLDAPMDDEDNEEDSETLQDVNMEISPSKQKFDIKNLIREKKKKDASKIELFGEPSWDSLTTCLSEPYRKTVVVVLSVSLWKVIGNDDMKVEVILFLDKLFEWSSLENARTVTIVTRGSCGSCDSFTIHDSISQSKLHVVEVGSIAVQSVIPAHHVEKLNVVSDRYTFTRTSITHDDDNDDVQDDDLCRRSYVSLKIFQELDQARMQHNFHTFPPLAAPKVFALMGPVLGQVISTQTTVETGGIFRVERKSSAVLLLEVDQKCSITCVIIDVLANHRMEQLVSLDAHIVSRIVWNGLLPERRYVYFFEGLSDSSERRGAFETPAVFPDQVQIVAVGADRPLELPIDTNINSWKELADQVLVPWHGIDTIVHLGGQVGFHTVYNEALCWLKAKWDENENDVLKINEWKNRVEERCRAAIRQLWNLPSTKTVLSHCSHIMLRSTQDLWPGYPIRVEENRLLQAEQIVQTALEKIFIEYQGACILQYNINVSSRTPSARWTIEVHDMSLEDNRELERHELKPEKEGDVDNNIHENLEKSYQMIHPYGDTMALLVLDLLALDDAPLSCSGRLEPPLPVPHNGPHLTEKQWGEMETLLKRKKVRGIIIVFDGGWLPTLNTTATTPSTTPSTPLTTALNGWQESCPKQCHQFLILLYRWQSRVEGRQVFLLSSETSCMEITCTYEKTQKIEGLSFSPLSRIFSKEEEKIKKKNSMDIIHNEITYASRPLHDNVGYGGVVARYDEEAKSVVITAREIYKKETNNIV